MTDSHIVEKNQPCGECGSSDAVQVYSDGHAFCYSCNHNYKDYNAYIEENNVQPEPKKQKAMTAFVPQLSLEEIASLGNKGFRERLIDKRVTAHFGVTAGMSGDTITEHYYPYTIAGKLSAFKKRVVATKEFQIVGEFKDVELFGQSVFREGGKRVVLTEGELDAMSYAQACLQESNQIYPVVSMPSATGIKAVKNNRAWLRSFDEVILWLDNDEAGENGLKAVAKAIGFDKVKVVKGVEKDCNDVLIKHGTKECMRHVWDASPYSPAGIIADKEVLWEQLEEYDNIVSVPYPECLTGLNEKLKGMRPGEITLWTSGTGSGKSTLLREIMLHLLETTDDKIGLVALEEAPAESARKLAGMAINKNPVKEPIPKDELRQGFDKVFGSNRVVVLDHHGSMNDGSIVDTLEAMCVMGAKYLFVDHITILVSEGADGLTGNEAIDKVMNDLLSVAKRHNVWIGLVSHLRKMTTAGSSFEDGKLASLDDIRGSGSIKQISFDILAFARNLQAQTETERNTIRMAVLKSRYTGLTGDCGTAVYNYDTGRLTYGGFAPQTDGAKGVFDIEI